jgi:ubiquinone/menaquinone biosynthesis C-methylase UbiE
MRLDVGCGAFHRGDVNCDMFKSDIGHRTGRKDVLGGKVRAPNFVLCDVTCLPFKSDSFEEVVSHHVIEHVDNPFKMLKEMVRVSQDRVVVFCPHALGERATQRRNPFHRSYFKKSWFLRASRVLCVNSVVVSYSKLRGFPSEFFPILVLPFELKTEIRK